MSTVVEQVWATLAHLTDPEIPVVTLRELGILRDVTETPDGVEVVITPTYTGCPAMGQIEDDVRGALDKAGIAARVITRLAPAWTTDWISAEGREKLRRYGIAPPGACADAQPIHLVARGITCPRCDSAQTERLSAFGSTACKSLYRCLSCREPFEHFKPI